jgi:hypothetical protein
MLALKNQCWEAKQSKGVSTCYHYIHNGIPPSTTLFVAIATSLIVSIGGICLFQPQFTFAQSAATADPSSTNLNTSAPLAVVAPVTIGNQIYQERGAVTTQ